MSDFRPCQFVTATPRYCGKPEESMHHGEDRWEQHGYMPPAPIPEPHQIVSAECTTTWTCHACGRTQDVEGEGAIYNWMDCGNPECNQASFLDPDLAEATG